MIHHSERAPARERRSAGRWARVGVALSAALLAPGCLQTQNHPVKTRRDAEVLEARAEAEKHSYEVLREQREQAREDARLSRRLQYANGRRARAREAAQRITETPGDSWRSYERDRRDVLYREWADAERELPPLKPDTDGPPGWLGPRKPDEPQPAEDPAEEPKEPAEGDDGGWGGDDDDGGWGGDDGGGDDGGDDGGWGGGGDGDGGDDGGWGSGGDDGGGW